MKKKFLTLLFLFSSLSANVVNEKILICGVAKNVERALPNTIKSIETLGENFLDYTVIIYENNSHDRTKEILNNWQANNPKVIFISENVTSERLRAESAMKLEYRIESIARARNIVLNLAMKSCFDDYAYVIMADLDFSEPWDIANILDTIIHPEQEWDAVFANGSYDLFAFRSPEFPIGYELIGPMYWWKLIEFKQIIKDSESFNPSHSWKPVYTAFGGLGIYKRESMRGCHYYSYVTKDLEVVTQKWLERAALDPSTPYLKEYQMLLTSLPIYNLYASYIEGRSQYPNYIGLRLFNEYGNGSIVWFSSDGPYTLPMTCEHVTFHATMALNGHDKLYINPRLIRNED